MASRALMQRLRMAFSSWPGLPDTHSCPSAMPVTMLMPGPSERVAMRAAWLVRATRSMACR
jgi:hypothetical protein